MKSGHDTLFLVVRPILTEKMLTPTSFVVVYFLSLSILPLTPCCCLVTFDDDDENIVRTVPSSRKNSATNTTSFPSAEAEDAEWSYDINSTQIRIFQLDEIIQEVIAKVRSDVLTIMNFIAPPILRSSVRRILSQMKAIVDRATPKVIAIIKEMTDIQFKNIITCTIHVIQSLSKQMMHSSVVTFIQDTYINMRDMLRRYTPSAFLMSKEDDHRW